MNHQLAAYLAAVAAMLLLDLLWLGWVARPLYLQGLGHLMAEAPTLWAAALFYAVYGLGLLRFAIAMPAARAAVLREQGVNGEVEMAAAFDRAGFEACDVHMSDVIEGRVSLESFRGFAACGGFSYGDVLGGGEGWAKSILYHARARDEFAAFFARPDTFALGVCNGCQMMAALKEFIPGAEAWPRFVKNTSEQFEARLVTVEVVPARRCSWRAWRGAVFPW